MKILVVGAGLIGCERIAAVQKISELTFGQTSLIGFYEPDPVRRESVEKKFQVNSVNNLDSALQNRPEWVFVCTPHDAVLPIIKKAFEIKANVLVEKPLGRSLKECQEIINSKPNDIKLCVGFNYRFFSGIERALKDCKEGKFGKLISVNLTLGHGNSPGMEKSWKLDPIKCGGGCLIDPGVHILDLILNISQNNIFLDSIKIWNGFWNTGIEEEAHILLHNEDETIFNAQISLNRWRSTFRLEINGTEGYGIVEGRGKSYGEQSYRIGKRWGWQAGKSQAASEELVISNYDCNDSFLKETISVLNLDIKEYRSTSNPCNYTEAVNIMELLEKCR